MNGGVQHAIEALSPDELEAALLGFRFFSFDDVASLLVQSTRNIDDDAADAMYAEMIPSDSVLVNRFEEFLKASPEIFAPL